MQFTWNMSEQEWKNYVSDCERLKHGETDGFSQSYIDGLHGECVVGLLHAHIVVDSRPEQFSEIYIDESEGRDPDEDLKWLDWGPVPDETAYFFESFKKKFEKDFEEHIRKNSLECYAEWRPTPSLYDHYRNCLAVQFGMTIAGKPELTTAWDVEQENLDVLFHEWTEQLLTSDYDDSFEFFQKRIDAWVSTQTGIYPVAELSEGSIKPGDTVYAIAPEKKLNAKGRWQTTRNPAVIRLVVTSVCFEPSDNDATLQAFIDGFREDNSNYQRISVDDCYLTEEAAKEALEMWGEE